MKRGQRKIHSSEKSRQAVIIPILVIQYGSLRAKLRAMRTAGPYMVRMFKEMFKGYSRLRKTSQTERMTIEQNELQELEAFAKGMGISHISYTKVKPEYIFRGFELLYDKAIVISMEMDHDDMKTNPSDRASKEIFRTYMELGIIVNKLAKFLEEKGFRCQASPAMGGDVMTVPLAQDAGFGVVGKHGLIISPEFGPSIRLAAVFVEIENLPIRKLEDNEHLWIKDFCEICNHCVDKCPGKAIYRETKMLEDEFPLFIDKEKCAPEFSKNCSQCISTCPFFYGNYNKVKERFDAHQKSGKKVFN